MLRLKSAHFDMIIFFSECTQPKNSNAKVDSNRRVSGGMQCFNCREFIFFEKFDFLKIGFMRRIFFWI